MQNGITTRAMRFMAHDFPHIFLVANMHDTTCGELVFDKGIEENFDGWHFQRTCNFRDSSSRICRKVRMNG